MSSFNLLSLNCAFNISSLTSAQLNSTRSHIPYRNPERNPSNVQSVNEKWQIIAIYRSTYSQFVLVLMIANTTNIALFERMQVECLIFAAILLWS